MTLRDRFSRAAGRAPAPYATLDAPGINGNPAGSQIRGTPQPFETDTREAAQERKPLAAKAERYRIDASISEQFDTPPRHDPGSVMTALDRLQHAPAPDYEHGDSSDRPQLPATISTQQMGSLMRVVLADMGIAPTAIQGISDRVQMTELVLARDMTDQRDAIDDQHDRLVRMEQRFTQLADTIKLANARAQDAEAQLVEIRVLLGLRDGDDAVAEVRKRLRWQRPVANADKLDSTPRSDVEADPGAGAVSASPVPGDAERYVIEPGSADADLLDANGIYLDRRNVPILLGESVSDERRLARYSYLAAIDASMGLVARERAEMLRLCGIKQVANAS